ncbi:MerR family transcriptional regulator [Rhodococcus sp. G-MC3]|uniref:MerR family transcriptional regulator n=1 Tax=Rhodococcus sp. G-MC3 TaxID=3046209 RepID=UPI0024B87B7C|nr:MerR family transcriptional regulator [Rhodococcus sp. G-MC3]MDJ0394076.1 MerR family transcriptional regulator [Rhodococcus sp. G-MC3]
MTIRAEIEPWKVGALAESTGLTVRTLHHYDHVGLLCPTSRNGAGHRLYTTKDVARLYRISLLRRLGFPLEQISHVLDDPDWDLSAAVQRHLTDTQRRAAVASALRDRLTVMADQLATHTTSPSPDQMFGALEEMAMLDSSVHSTTTILIYDDLPAAHEYLVRVYGLTPGPLERTPDGTVVHGEVRAGEQVIWMHPAGEGFRSPSELGGVSGMTVINVEDADKHYARSVAAGAVIIEEPVDQNYGVREYGARDAEGQLWYFHSPLD